MFNYCNQSSNGNVIHKDDVKFPNFSQNAANFPNSMGPGPISKKGCESPAGVMTLPMLTSECDKNECCPKFPKIGFRGNKKIQNT